MDRPTSYLPTLDGWRAVAVIGVILYHGRFGFFGFSSILTRLSAHGNIGVDIFFPISGFLVCRLLLQEHARVGSIRLSRFYWRRCLRILPPYYGALAGFCALAMLGVIHLKHWEIASSLLFARNYMPLGMDQQGGFYTAHFWSLALEWQFYLTFPLLLVATKPKRAGKWVFLLALAILSWRAFDAHFQLLPRVFPPANLLVRSDTRMDALLWGCLAAIYLPAIKRVVERINFSQLWLPIMMLLLITEALHVPGLYFCRSILLPALVVSTVLQPASWLGRVLEWRLVAWIGTLSYSIYLWQELFLPQVDGIRAHGGFRHLQQWPWNIVAILVVACISRYLLELPMTRLSHRPSAPPLPSVQPQYSVAGH